MNSILVHITVYINYLHYFLYHTFIIKIILQLKQKPIIIKYENFPILYNEIPTILKFVIYLIIILLF